MRNWWWVVAVAFVVWLLWKGGNVLKSLAPYADIVSREAAATGVPETWIYAVILTESSGKATAYRAEPRIHDASYGLMQVLYRTATGLGYTGDVEGLYDPATNIHLGVKLLAQLRQRHGTNFSRIYSAYNSGSPDLYQTSTQVAKHVDNALKNLARVTA